MPTLRKHLSDALIARGYRRRGRGHLLRVDDDFSFCVDTGVIGPRTDIAPEVGIRSDAVETTRADLMSLPANDWTATTGANVGYVLGAEYRWWEAGAPVEQIMGEILAALESLRPFMTLQSLGDVFTRDWAARNPGAPYAQVVIALINGDRTLVAKGLTHAERIFCAQHDEVCEQYRAFEARVRSRFDTTTWR